MSCVFYILAIFFQFTGMVSSVEDWVIMVQKLNKAWHRNVTAESIMNQIKLFESSTLEVKNFGLYREHTGMTLAEWAEENGMYDILKNV